MTPACLLPAVQTGSQLVSCWANDACCSGYDGKLCLNDFNFDRCTFAHTDIHDTISSVRWGQQMETGSCGLLAYLVPLGDGLKYLFPCLDPHLVSLTTDSGDFMMFDTRVELNAVLNFSVVQMVCARIMMTWTLSQTSQTAYSSLYLATLESTAISYFLDLGMEALSSWT